MQINPEATQRIGSPFGGTSGQIDSAIFEKSPEALERAPRPNKFERRWEHSTVERD